MEWIERISNIITLLLGAIGGSGLMYYTQNKKLKESEVRLSTLTAKEKEFELLNKQMDILQSLLEKQVERTNTTERKVEELQRQTSELYEANNEKERKISELEITIDRLRHNYCDRGCKRRRNPFEREIEDNEPELFDNENENENE